MHLREREINLSLFSTLKTDSTTKLKTQTFPGRNKARKDFSLFVERKQTKDFSSQKTNLEKDICIFQCSLHHSIAKIWKQSMSSSGWVDKEDMTYTHTMEYYSAIKKEKNLTIWMNLKGIMFSEVSHTENDKHHMTSHTHGNLKRRKSQTAPGWRRQTSSTRGKGRGWVRQAKVVRRHEFPIKDTKLWGYNAQHNDYS